MQQQELIPHLFRTEYRKITAVLCKLFGLAHIGIAEDIASDIFLLASETWALKGLPPNPTAWLYTAAKNKAKDHLKRNTLFNNKIVNELCRSSQLSQEIDIDLSDRNIADSQLQMLFAICHPVLLPEAQIGLALRILCGFGIGEIADAFLTGKETINKRLFRAKEKLRTGNFIIAFPPPAELTRRLESVATTLYLLFNEGYYSQNRNVTLRKDLCLEAMRLTSLLLDNESTNLPQIQALLALMCFQASRLDARSNAAGETILYHDQDPALWDIVLIERGEYFLRLSAKGERFSKYHLEAGIASWYTQPVDSPEKWESILQLYNQLLQVEYSPVAALNRTYALSKANGKQQAIEEAEKLKLTGNHLYYSLLGELYSGIDNEKAVLSLRSAFALAQSPADKAVIDAKLKRLGV